MRYLQNYKQFIASTKSNYLKNFISFSNFEDEEDENFNEILPKIKVKIFESFINKIRENEN